MLYLLSPLSSFTSLEVGAVQRDDNALLLANVTNALELARVVQGECMPHLRSLTLREPTQPPPPLPGEEGVKVGRELLASMKQLSFLSIQSDCALLCYVDALPRLSCLHLECSIADKAPPHLSGMDALMRLCTRPSTPLEELQIGNISVAMLLEEQLSALQTNAEAAAGLPCPPLDIPLHRLRLHGGIRPSRLPGGVTPTVLSPLLRHFSSRQLLSLECVAYSEPVTLTSSSHPVLVVVVVPARARARARGGAGFGGGMKMMVAPESLFRGLAAAPQLTALSLWKEREPRLRGTPCGGGMNWR
jgi:hypothetical protein